MSGPTVETRLASSDSGSVAADLAPAGMAPDRSIGTRRPLLALGLIALAHAAIHAQSALMPLIYPLIIREYALDASAIGVFIAVSSFVGGSMQLAYGFLTRWIARPLLLGGGQLLFGAGLLLSSLANGVPQLLGAISAARVGASPQHPVGNAVLSDAFPAERRGFAISAHISGGNVGTILVPFIAGGLLAVFGWQGTLALFGVPSIVIGLIIALAIREDGARYRRQARATGSVGAQFGQVMRRRDIQLILGASLIAAGGRGLDIVAPFMVLYLTGPLGFGDDETRLLYGLLLVGAVVGPLLAGWLSDHFGRRRTLVTYYALSAAGILAFLAAGANLVLLIPLLLPFGTAVFSESPVLQAYLADRAAGPMRDVAFSVYFTFAFGIGAFWAFVIGFVADAFGYPIAFGVMAASYLAAALLVLAVRERREAPLGA
jgi:MFS transporter, FSR family, fosmidomycin resistance protein